MKLKFNNNEKVWLFSDPHFHHTNLIASLTKWTNRPLRELRQFDSEDQMNQQILDNLNNNVQPNDHLFCLGDWTFGDKDSVLDMRKRIVCKNLYLVKGNHDKYIDRDPNIRSGFKVVDEYIELRVKDELFCLFHYPIESWNKMHRGSFMLHGHQHLPKRMRIKPGRKMDVGLDGNDMLPIQLDECYELLKDRTLVEDYRHKVETE